MPRLLPPSPAEAIRRRLAREVHEVFHTSADEPRVLRSANALIAADSVAWRVHGDVTTMMVGGIAALLLQMLHPAALAGVWDHSKFEQDMLGRLRRTARFIAVTTFAERAQGEAMIERVARIHDRSRDAARRPAYSANDPATLAFVHVAGALMFLDAFVRFAEPRMRGPTKIASSPRLPGSRGRSAPIPFRNPRGGGGACSRTSAPSSSPTRGRGACATSSLVRRRASRRRRRSRRY